MSFLSRLFGAKAPKGGGGDLDTRLERLETEAEEASPGYVGTSLNRAGDLARKEGQLGRAVQYYGRAIDAFLEDAQREAARGVANKIIRVRPDAVRTLCTLTWLDLSARHSATALLHLRDYVSAAEGDQQRAIAASQIYEMARIVPESEFVGAVADALDKLDFADEASEVREWVKAKGSPGAIEDDGELAQACLQAAVKSNERGTLGDALDEGNAITDGRGLDDDGTEAEAVDGADEVPARADESTPDGGEPLADAPDSVKPARRYRWD